jgi:uncharacterized Ntn-hydrolase superfamily protein
VTYSIAGHCPRTGMFGVAVTTSSIAVGSRCAFAKAGVGAVLTQHRTDPRLGPRGIALLEQGRSAADTVTALTRDEPGIGFRQLAVIDRTGRTAWYHGDRITSIHKASEGDGCVAIGNIIRTPALTDAMVEAFASQPGEHLAERLLRALEAGLRAGGEFRQEKSAALLVVHEQSFPLVDLRVDYDRSPIVELRFLWENYLPQMQLYVARALDPATSDPAPAAAPAPR